MYKKTISLIIFLFVTLSFPPVSGAVYNLFPVQALPISAETPKVVLQQGTAGTSTIYINNTSAKVRVAAPIWWNPNYNYRRQISVVNNVASTLGSGYSVRLQLNTASLVSSGKMLASGNDLRIVYWNGSSWIEIDRDIINMNTGSTQVWFKTRADISASGSDNNYYMYYGNPSAGIPPANKRNVYDFWDDFDDASLDPAWTFSQIGGASGSYSESGTVLRLTAATSGDLWDTSDNFLFLSISRGYDVIVESYTSGWGGSHNTWSKMGGVQLRQSLDANSKNRIMSPVYSAVGATNSYRLSTGGVTDEQTTSTQARYNRLSRVGGASRAWYSTDGISWTELGTQISFSSGLSNPVRLGIHLAGLSSSSHWAEVDWFKVRLYVDPEPSTIFGSEENRYESTLPWWNSSWKYRRLITVTEKGIAARADNPVDFYITFPSGHCYDPSIRILKYNGSWIEIPSQVWNKTLSGSFITSCAVSFMVDSIALSGSAQYYIYYTDTNQGEGGYTNISITDNASKWGYNDWIFINDKLKLYIRKSIVGTFVVDSVTGTSWNYTRTTDPNSYQSNYGQMGPYEIWGSGATTTFPTAKPIRIEIEQNMAGPKNATFIYYKGQKYIKLILKSNVNWPDNIWDIQGVFEVGTASAVSWGTNNKYCRVYGNTGTIVYTTEGAVWVLSVMNDPNWYDNPGFRPSDLTDKEQNIYILYGGPNLSQADAQALIDIIENPLETSLGTETITYDYVLRIANQVTSDWKVNLKVYDSFNIGRLSSAKISLHDGTTSDQIIVSGGVITQSEGALYDLADSATIYISISNLQATTSDVSRLYLYLKVQVPNTSTYNLFIITLEIT